jgi:hypothetical protein
MSSLRIRHEPSLSMLWSAMRDALVSYFTGEKHAGLLAAGVGVVALVAAALLWQPRWGLRSFAVALGAFALVELAVGVGLYVKTGPQTERLLGQLEAAPAQLRAGEGARMVKVQRNFGYLEVGWIVLVAATAVAAVVFKERATLSGVAMALLLHAAFLLAFDLVAERRGAAYLAALQATPES